MEVATRLAGGSVRCAGVVLDHVAPGRSKVAAGLSHALPVVPSSSHSISEVQRLSLGQSLGDAKNKRIRQGVSAMMDVPRLCTLREFGEGVDEAQLMLRPIRVRSSGEGVETPQATVLELIAANAEASAQVQSFETVAGRAAMVSALAWCLCSLQLLHLDCGLSA